MSFLISPVGMTSDTAPIPYVATDSGHYNGYLAYYAFRGGANVEPWLGQGGAPWWLAIDLGSAQLLGSYSIEITTQTVGTLARAPNAWQMQGSNDGSTWVTLDTQAGITWTTDLQVQTFSIASPSTPYRYYRIDITANNGDSYCQILLLSLYLASTPGVYISKANLYGLLSPLPGANISKANVYAVVGNPLAPVSTVVPSSGGAVSRCQVSHVLPSRLLARDWSAFQRQIEALRPADVEEVKGSRFDFC